MMNVLMRSLLILTMVLVTEIHMFWIPYPSSFFTSSAEEMWNETQIQVKNIEASLKEKFDDVYAKIFLLNNSTDSQYPLPESVKPLCQTNSTEGESLHWSNKCNLTSPTNSNNSKMIVEVWSNQGAFQGSGSIDLEKVLNDTDLEDDSQIELSITQSSSSTDPVLRSITINYLIWHEDSLDEGTRLLKVLDVFCVGLLISSIFILVYIVVEAARHRIRHSLATKPPYSVFY